MNYLVIEGYKDAAESFSSECGLPPTVSDFASIQDRMEIRKCVQQGRIEEAIERVNDLDPEILDTNPDLYFRLQQQRLIEYIREDQVDEALEFAQEELAPRGEENPKFLKELERTLSLLAFDSRGPSPVQDLLSFSHRQKTAAELNSIILLSQSYETDPQLPLLLKLVVWTQDLLGKRVWFPKITNLATAALQDSTMSSGG